MPEFQNPWDGIQHWIGQAEQEHRAGNTAAASSAAAIAQAYAMRYVGDRTN